MKSSLCRSIHRQVAIKVLPDEFDNDRERLARFQREAEVLASLSHPNIASLYGLEQSEGKRFIVMELLDGETLAQRLIIRIELAHESVWKTGTLE